MDTKKTEHKVGERLYLSQITGSFYIDAIKTPWTVVESKPSSITVQRAREIYNGPRYYDTLPDDIQEDPNRETLKLIWSKARGGLGRVKRRQAPKARILWPMGVIPLPRLSNGQIVHNAQKAGIIAPTQTAKARRHGQNDLCTVHKMMPVLN